MIAGFKTGLQTFAEGQRIVEEDGARMCEVWFDVTRAEEYDDMLNWLAEHNVAVGLHHWGVVDGQLKTNLATQNETIRQATIKQIKDTIDIAAERGCVYVNAHCGARFVERLTLPAFDQELVPEDQTEELMSTRLFLTAAHELNDFAQTKNILLTIETLPALETRNGPRRDVPYDAFNTNLSTMINMCRQGNFLANDVSHTAAQVMKNTTDLKQIWQEVMEFTKKTAAQTRLLHINTLRPPFNGTDSHDGITEEDFVPEAFPTREQLKEWLTVFKNRNDVYVIPEPRRNTMQTNYQALTKLVVKLY